MSFDCIQSEGCFGVCASGNNVNNSGQQYLHGQPQLQQVQLHNNVATTATATATATTTSTEDEDILVKELNSLSFQEREKVFDELHGVSKIIKETPEFIQSCIDKLQEEIDKVSRRRRKVMNHAFFLKPSLRYDKKFLIMFLRATSFDPYEAAQRMARYFNHKLYLFGEDKLVKDITLEDLTNDDLECLHSGCFQILKDKDRAGRTILLCEISHCRYAKSWLNLTRCGWYQVMCSVEDDEETQIHGIVDLIHAVGLDGLESNLSDLISRGCPMLMDMPFRFVGTHFCYDHPKFRPVLVMFQMFCTRYIRLRFRVHYGSTIECLYAVMTFGIPRHFIPINPDGSLDHSMNQQRLKDRQKMEMERKQKMLEYIEQQEKKNGILVCPRPNDVLLGRGRPFREYVGNQQLVDLVEMERVAYQKAGRSEKTNIIISVVEKVYQLGGRFLQQQKNNKKKNNNNNNNNNEKDNNRPIGWQIVNDRIAREKVSQTFRTEFNCKKAENHHRRSSSAGSGEGELEVDEIEDDEEEEVMEKEEEVVSSSSSSFRNNKRIRYDKTLLVEE